jgi:hypothetical protein
VTTRTLAVAVAVGLMMAACEPPIPEERTPGEGAPENDLPTVIVQPDAGWTVSGEGAPENLGIIIRVVKEQSPCDPGEWAGTIEFVPAFAMCGSINAYGCAWADAEGVPHVWVTVRDGYVNTIIHELGHIAWGRCGGVIAEQAGFHQTEFYDWIRETAAIVSAST